MSNFNKLVRIASDIEARAAGDHMVYSFSVVYDTGFGDKKKPCFIEVQAWNKTGEIVQKHLGKGRQVSISATLEQDTWEDKETGSKRSKHYLSLDGFDFVNDGSGGDSGGNQPAPFGS